jgi:hypothetical protein
MQWKTEGNKGNKGNKEIVGKTIFGSPKFFQPFGAVPQSREFQQSLRQSPLFLSFASVPDWAANFR